MNHYQNQNQLIDQALRETAKQTELAILAQLNELISRGLLVVETEGPMIVQQMDYMLDNKIQVGMRVKLKLKDQEYIERLEAENKELLELVNKFKSACATVVEKK